MRERTFRAAGGVNILLERSWTVTDIFTLAEAPSQLLMSCWYLSLPIKQLFPLRDAQSVHVEERSRPAEAGFTSGLQQQHNDIISSHNCTTLTRTNTTGGGETEWHQPIRRQQLVSPFWEDNFRKISSSDASTITTNAAQCSVNFINSLTVQRSSGTLVSQHKRQGRMKLLTT